MPFEFPWQVQLLSPSSALHEAGTHYHHAAQFLAAVGQHLLSHEVDDSHTNLGWESHRQVFVGRWIEEKIRLGLDYRQFALFFENQDNKTLASFSLAGKTKGAAWTWLKASLNSWGFPGNELSAIDHYDLPEHALDKEQTSFDDIPTEYRQELQRYRQNTQAALLSVAKQSPDWASAIRTWPHHYDSAILLEVVKDDSGQLQASVGVGLAIPDSVADSYYFYVSPWRRDTTLSLDALPPLSYGHWQTNSFTGAVLPLSELVASTDDQQKQLSTFLSEAIDASLELIN